MIGRVSDTYGENVDNIYWRTSECTGLNEVYIEMYTAEMQYVWSSKNMFYEKPCVVIGNGKHTGSKEAPKGISNDRRYWNKGSLGRFGTFTSDGGRKTVEIQYNDSLSKGKRWQSTYETVN